MAYCMNVDQPLQSDDETPEALLGRALAARAGGDLDAAIELFGALFRLEPANLGAGCELAFTLLIADRMDESEAMCLGLLEQDPGLRAALATLGSISRQRGDIASALDFFQRAAAAEPDHVPTLLEVAVSLRDLARFDDATAVYFEILALDPDSADALRGLAETCRAMGRHAPSLVFYTLLGRRDPGDLAAIRERGFALLRLGRLDDAERAFRAALAADPANPTPYRGRALVAQARGRPRPAIGYLNEALRRDPTDPWALMDLGFAHRALDERPRALEAFLAAAVADPVRALPEAALEHRALGQLAETNEVLRRVIALDPENLAARLQLAELARIKGDMDACLALCDALIDRYPDRLEARIEKCRALIEADRKEEAVALARSIEPRGKDAARAQALRLEVAGTCLDPVFAGTAFADAEPALGDLDVCLAAAVAHLALADAAGARSVLARLATPSRSFDIGRLRELEGGLASLEWRPRDAIAAFLAALEANPATAEAHRHLARLFLLTVEPERAADHLAQFLRRAASERRLQGQSLRLSQNLVGQLLNELRSDAEAFAELRRIAAPDTRIDEAIDAVSRYPSSTPAALHLLLRLRMSGELGVGEAPSDAAAAAVIPRSIMAYWPDQRLPAAIADGFDACRDLHAAWRFAVFDRQTGQAFIEANHPPDVAAAGRRALADGQFEDLLRLAILGAQGGYVLDARARCLAPLDGAHRPGARLVAVQDEFAALSRTLVACAPGEDVVDRALGLAVEAINRGDNDIPWLATGPGLISRAFVESLAGQGDDRRLWLADRVVLDRPALRSVLIPGYVVGR